MKAASMVTSWSKEELLVGVVLATATRYGGANGSDARAQQRQGSRLRYRVVAVVIVRVALRVLGAHGLDVCAAQERACVRHRCGERKSRRNRNEGQTYLPHVTLLPEKSKNSKSDTTVKANANFKPAAISL
jgi:hypothetical protein